MALYLGDKLISSNLAGGDTNPIGSVIAFAGSNAPVGYLMCDGSAVSRETYAELFAVIGTTYGSGDGSTTFNLPNYPDEEDYVIEEGNNGNWIYRKWDSGRADCSYRGNYGTMTLYLDLSGTDMVSESVSFAFPFTFYEIPSCVVGYEGSDAGYATLQNPAGATAKATTTRSYHVRLCRIGTQPVTLTNNVFTVHANGYWKAPVDIPSKKHIIKATHNVTIQGVDTMSEAEYQDLLERLV